MSAEPMPAEEPFAAYKALAEHGVEPERVGDWLYGPLKRWRWARKHWRRDERVLPAEPPKPPELLGSR